MAKELKSSVVTLKTEAKKASLLMLEELKREEINIKIDHSKLVSFVVNEYQKKYFKKEKKKIITFFKDSKRQIKGRLTELSNEQLEVLSKYIEKMKPEITKQELANDQ